MTWHAGWTLSPPIPNRPTRHPALPGGLFCPIGNPLSNDAWQYNWQNGLRVQKTATSTGVTKYTLHGKNIVHMTQGSNSKHFFYDASNKPAIVEYNGSKFAYVHNLQGDIVAILNSAGTAVVNYVYDAWGRPISCSGIMASTLGKINPFRYRGYVYDEETNLYYVSTRYHNPTTVRFLNSDDVDLLGINGDFTTFNLFAYCGNAPISRSDANGGFWLTVGIMAIGGVIGAAVSAVSSAVTQQALTGTVNWKSVGVAAATGFVSGAVAASPLGIQGQKIAGGIIGGLSYVADCYVNDKPLKLDDAMLAVGMGYFSGKIGGAGANENMMLTDSAHRTMQVITREAHRANQEYAQKAKARAIGYCINLFEFTTWEASVRFAIGTGVSNGVTTEYGDINPLPQMPSWKPW